MILDVAGVGHNDIVSLTTGTWQDVLDTYKKLEYSIRMNGGVDTYSGIIRLEAVTGGRLRMLGVPSGGVARNFLDLGDVTNGNAVYNAFDGFLATDRIRIWGIPND